LLKESGVQSEDALGVKLKASIRFDSGGESREEIVGNLFEEEDIVGVSSMRSSCSAE